MKFSLKNYDNPSNSRVNIKWLMFYGKHTWFMGSMLLILVKGLAEEPDCAAIIYSETLEWKQVV